MTWIHSDSTSATSGSIVISSPGYVTTDFAVDTELESGTKMRVKNGKKCVGPGLYFKFVKSKFTTMQETKLKQRLLKLQKLIGDTRELGQIVLYEELSKSIAVTVRELEAMSCGIDTYVMKKDIEKFMDITKDRVVKFTTSEKFPRCFPENVKKKLFHVRERSLFDEYWVLYIDYTGEPERKTNKEKIRQKDPILFGQYSYEPGKFYFIIDWIDDYCDITLDQMVDTLKGKDFTYEPHTMKEPDKKWAEKIKNEVLARHERLKNTKPGNYQGLMVAEDQSYARFNVFKRLWHWLKKKLKRGDKK